MNVPPDVKAAMFAALAVIGVGLGATYVGQRRGMFGVAQHLVRMRIGRRFIEPRIEKLRDMIWAGIGLLCLATFRDNDSRPDISFEITTSFSLISQGVSPPSARRRLDSRSTHSSPTLNDPAPLRP